MAAPVVPQLKSISESYYSSNHVHHLVLSRVKSIPTALIEAGTLASGLLASGLTLATTPLKILTSLVRYFHPENQWFATIDSGLPKMENIKRTLLKVLKVALGLISTIAFGILCPKVNLWLHDQLYKKNNLSHENLFAKRTKTPRI